MGNEVAEFTEELVFSQHSTLCTLPFTDMVRQNGFACQSRNWLLPASLNTNLLQSSRWTAQAVTDVHIKSSYDKFRLSITHTTHTVACQVRSLSRTVITGSVIWFSLSFSLGFPGICGKKVLI